MDAIEHLIDMVSPYLPSSLTNPLYQILSTPPSSASTDPAQLVPLLVSVLALYAAAMSLYNTTRSFVRFAWFCVKWLAIASALAVVWSGYNGAGTEEGVTKGFRQATSVGKGVYDVGRRGLRWWIASGGAEGRSAKSRTSRRARTAGKQGTSASGARRTWSTYNDDGEWDDPPEVDLGGGAGRDTADVLKTVRDSVLTFLSSPNQPDQRANDGSSGRTKQRAKAQPKTKTRRQAADDDGGADLGQWATNFALNRARRAWNDMTGGGR